MKRILLIVIVAGFSFYLINPAAFKSFTQPYIEHAKSAIFTRLSQSTRELSQKTEATIAEKSQRILGSAIGAKKTTPTPLVNAVNNVDSSEEKQIILLDYLTHQNRSLSLKHDQNYFLDLRNIPKNYCLFINETSYEPSQHGYLKVSFPSSGRYQLSFDECPTTPAKFGEIVVE